MPRCSTPAPPEPPGFTPQPPARTFSPACYLLVADWLLVTAGAFVFGLEELLLLLSLSVLPHPVARSSNNAPRIKFLIFITFPFHVERASVPRDILLSPSSADEYMPAIAILVVVRCPNRAAIWRTIPMTCLPLPMAPWPPDPDSPDPDKIGAWHGYLNVHFRRRWRWSARNHHLGRWRIDVNAATGNTKPRCDCQNNRFQHFNLHTQFLSFDSLPSRIKTAAFPLA